MEEVKKQNVDVKSMSKEERNALLAQLQQEEKNDRIARRETYEALRAEFMHDVKNKVTELVSDVKGFRDWLETEAEAFTSVMREYAMTLLERNKMGDLDYKSISKLYELEDKFDEEYADIMRLFKEANVVQRNATNYYFSRRNPDNGVWTRIEPSFCRL